MAKAKIKEIIKISQPNIIGLDLSLRATGWAKYNKTNKLLENGVIESKQKGMERLDEIVTSLSEKIPNDSIVYIENYGFASKGQVVYQGELGGLVRHMLWKRKIKYIDVPATTCKKFLTGSGSCDKALILKELYKKYQIDVNEDNIADAIVLALIGRAKDGDLEVTKAQAESIKKVDQDESHIQ